MDNNDWIDELIERGNQALDYLEQKYPDRQVLCITFDENGKCRELQVDKFGDRGNV